MIRAREDTPRRARTKGGGEGAVPVAAEQVGRPLTYSNVDRIVERTQRRVGFHFTVHRLRHTYATLAYRDGVQLEVIGALLTHRSPTSTLIYTHATAEDLRVVLAERCVLEKVADLLG